MSDESSVERSKHIAPLRQCNLLWCRNIAKRLLSMLVVAGWCACAAVGQSTSGSILGVVTDPSDAVVPGAAVTVRNEATGWNQTATSDERGGFVFAGLPPGSYSVAIAKNRFKTLEQPGVELILDQKLRLDFHLEVGPLSESVIVTAAVPTLETQSAGTGEVIGSRQILDLPLLGRNFLDLSRLAPGVAAGAGGNNANYSVNGQREFGNSLVVNGIEVTGNRNNDTNVRPSVDAVEEFKVLTSSFAPEFGRAIGGVIAVQTKAGGNALHGSIYDFARTPATTARTFFAGQPSSLKQQNFGVSAGGPVARNRTFFFASYEGLRSRDTWSYLDTTVPSQMVRVLPGGAVDLSGLRDPFTGQQVPIFDPEFYNNNYYSQPFPGNVIPAARVSQAGLKILTQLFPRPNVAGVDNGWFSNLAVGQRYRFDSDTGDLRIDHDFSGRDRISGTYDAKAFSSLTGDPFAGMIPVPGGGSGDSADVSDSMNQSIGLAYLHTIGPRQLNDFRAAHVRTSFYQNDLLHGTNLARQFGIANANLDGFPQTDGFPQIQLASGATTGGSTYKPLTFLDQNFQIGDTWTWTPVRHQVRAGYEYRHLVSHPNFSLFPTSYQYYYGAYSSMTSDPSYAYYDPSAYYGNGGSEVADLLLGLPGYTAQGLQLTNPATSSAEHHVFLQDSWQVTRKLVVTYGVRYEYQAPYTETHNNAANFDASALSMLLAGRGGNLDSLVNPDKNNFAPRLGVALRLRPNTVLRAGWGVFYTPENSARSDVLTKNYPFFVQQQFFNYPGTPITYVLDTGAARPTSIPVPAGAASIDLTKVPGATNQSVYAIDPNFQTGYGEVASLMVQHEFAPGFAVEAGYVGEVSHKLPYAVGNLNRANAISSRVGTVQAQFSEGNSDYHSLQAKLERRFSHGIGFLVSYTFSKSIDNGPAPFDLGVNHQAPQDPYHLNWEQALSSTDARHNLVFSYIWGLPWGHSLQGWRRAAFSGWQLNGITSLRSGLPVNVVRNGGLQGYEGLRPNVLRDPNLSDGQRTLSRYFDTSAFSVAGLGKTSPGSAGRNILEGPGFSDLDVSLFKEATITERLRAELRFEAFNILNRPNFGAPNSDFSSGQFGQITSTVGVPRIFQFAVKCRF